MITSPKWSSQEKYKPHPHQTRNVNRAHHESLTVNDKIALRVSGIVGTMWFCYGLALVMFFWALLQQTILPALHINAFDPFPFSFLFFCLGGIMQSLLMPMIMVEQNRQSCHAMQVADAAYSTDIKTHKDVETVIEQNNEIIQQNAEIIKQNEDQVKMIEALFAAPVTVRRRVRKQEVDQT